MRAVSCSIALSGQLRWSGRCDMFYSRREWMDRLATMEAFIRVVETGSFAAAARQLHVGQPAVSKQASGAADR